MAQVINTNISSLNAQRNLSTSQASLTTSLQRLSSGLRINSAKDDAAGLAISERMSAQIRGNDQAQRNANDGISLAQTAEGDLNTVSTNLQRLRELAVQSSNASNSASDRASLNNEASQLIAEIDRVASNSQFNGIKLLDGTFNAQTFQVGANNTATDQITIAAIASAKSSALGVGSSSSYSTSVAGAAVGATALVANSLSINGHLVGAASSDGVSFATSSASGIAVAAAINAISGDTGVTASVGTTSVAGTGATGFGTAILAGDVTINGVSIGAIAIAGDAAERGGQVTAAINAISSQTGVTATFNTTSGAVALSAADGRNVTVGFATGAAGVAATVSGLGTTTVATTTTTRSAVSLSSSSSAGITIADLDGAGAAASGLTVGYTAASVSVGAGVSSLDLTTAAGAQNAISILDAAINNVNTSRGTLGAFQNRFANVVDSLQTRNENMSASRSRITDADFAKETANLTRAQILQQAGTAMLSQANQLPQGVLSLLQ